MYVGVPTVSYVGIKLIQPMKSPELRATLLQRTTRNPLIYDEFFVTFTKVVINRQDL